MRIEATLSDICNIIILLKETSQNLVLDNVQSLIRQSVTFNDAIIIKKGILLGKLQIKFTIKSVEDGTIEINIISATVFGLSFFGVVRVKAAQILMQILKQHEPNIYIWKHTNGNLRLQSPRIKFNFAQIINDMIMIDLSCLNKGAYDD